MTLASLPDKDLAVIFHHEARKYIVAAEIIAERSDLDLVTPRYFLRCHAIELLLKSALLAKGISLSKAEAYKHDLIRAYDDAKALGLIVREETVETIQRLSSLHLRHQFRYRKHSKREAPIMIAFPNDEVARRSIEDLFEQCRLLISATRSQSA